MMMSVQLQPHTPQFGKRRLFLPAMVASGLFLLGASPRFSKSADERLVASYLRQQGSMEAVTRARFLEQKSQRDFAWGIAHGGALVLSTGIAGLLCWPRRKPHQC